MKKNIIYTLFLLASFIGINYIMNDSTKIHAIVAVVGDESFSSEDSSINGVIMTTYISSVKQEFAGLGSGMTPILKDVNYYSYNEIKIYKEAKASNDGYQNNNGMPIPIIKKEYIKFSAGSYSLNIISSGDQSHMKLQLMSSSGIRDLNLNTSFNNNATNFNCEFSSNYDFHLIFKSSLTESKNLSQITFSPITVEQVDNSAPVFDTQVFITSSKDPSTLEYILSQVKFVDEVDGVITVTKDNITLDTYSSNKYNVGKWQIILTAKDKAGNSATGTLEVWVQDKTPPTITGQTSYTSNMSSPLTESYLRTTLIITDNVDTNFNINLISDNFSNNKSIIGTYTVSYNVIDSNGNTSNTFTIAITTVDDIKPTITGTSNYNSSYQTLIDLETIKSNLVLKDNVSDTTAITLQIKENNYTDNFNTPGTHSIKFIAIDEKDNTSNDFIVTINVSDIVPPLFYTSNSFIGISQATLLSSEELSKILLDMEGLANTGNTIEILSSNYNFKNDNDKGTYTVSYRVRYTDNALSNTKSLIIKVYEEATQDDNNETKNPIENTTKKETFFKRVLNALKYFFVNLFKSIAFIFTFGKVKPNW